jgi:L-lactate dehydrogenase complex protein LldG
MSARESVLAGIRRSLGVAGDEATRRFEVETRLKAAPPGVVPKRGQGDAATRLAVFKAEAERAQASLAEVGTWAEAPAEIARFLRENNCPATLRMGADARLAAMPWGETALEILHGASDGRDANAVSVAFGGIAESGTLALVSGADNPTTLNFLAENHIVVLPREAIAADYESVFASHLWQGPSAAHAQFHHRPVAVGRHRADAPARRPRTPAAAYRRRRRSLKAGTRFSPRRAAIPQREIFIRACNNRHSPVTLRA